MSVLTLATVDEVLRHVYIPIMKGQVREAELYMMRQRLKLTVDEHLAALNPYYALP